MNIKVILPPFYLGNVYTGAILNGYVIDHKDNNKMNNSLCNLQLLTPKQNCKTYCNSVKKPYFKRPKPVKAINLSSKETSYFSSTPAAGEKFNDS